MSARVERNGAGHVVKITITCDHPGCVTESPPEADVGASGGLNNMGWHCSGGRHLCPCHKEGQ